jgi:hypothetical protein
MVMSSPLTCAAGAAAAGVRDSEASEGARGLLSSCAKLERAELGAREPKPVSWGLGAGAARPVKPPERAALGVALPRALKADGWEAGAAPRLAKGDAWAGMAPREANAEGCAAVPSVAKAEG